MKNILMIFFAGCTALVLASCAKEQISADKYYYGKVNAKMANFPGSVSLDVYFDNQKLGVLDVNVPTSYQVPAGKAGHFSLKAAGTDSVKMDTLISVPRDKTISLSVAYSKASGISGFLSVGQPISADSLGVQFLNGFSDKHPNRILAKLMYVDTKSSIVFTGIQFQLDRNQLASQVIKLPKKFPGMGSTTYYILELHDAATGADIPNASIGGRPICAMDTFPGQVYIVKIADQGGGTSFFAQSLPI